MYDVDPLICPKCCGEMRVISFIMEYQVIRRILDHLDKKGRSQWAAGKARARHGAGVGVALSSAAPAFACRREGAVDAAQGVLGAAR